MPADRFPGSRGRWAGCAMFAVFVMLAVAPGAFAQQADAAGQALARAQGLLRQLAQEKAGLDAEVAKLRAENAKLQKTAGTTEARLEETSSSLESVTREAAGVRTKLGSTEKRLERTTGQLKDVVAKYREQALKLRETEARRNELEANLDATARQLEDAERKNLALYRLNREILTEFEKEGPWDGLLRKEPVIGFKRVEIENLVQEYEDKMRDELRGASLEQMSAPGAN
jgi:chromosome segregation ATPase